MRAVWCDKQKTSSKLQSELVNVTKIYSNKMAFAALRSDGTVGVWGPSSSMQSQYMLLCMSCSTIGWMGSKSTVYVAAELMQC